VVAVPSQAPGRHRVLLRGAVVEHLFDDGRLDPHRPTPAARVDGRRLVYDGGEPGLPLRES
jgi:hypothetical protein